MEKIIEFRKYPLDMILDKLLLDKTTGKRIIWATDGYSEYGEKYCDRYEITSGALIGINPVLIQPRAFKALETQQQRTKSKAEVFTPSWIVNKMVNHLDEEWFGRSDVFNIADNQMWQSKTEKIDFGKKKWKDYVDRTVLEITCGEAPFIVSRYNASTGEIIPIEDRIGVLDRKLRVVTENTDNEEDWVKWAQRAFESVFGYEYQGDNLLIGRINLLMTFVDYYQHIWGKEVGKKLLTTITNIITWNFWQMDGLNGTVPLGVPEPIVEQMTLFDIEEEKEEKAPLCKVRQWRAKKTILYKEIEMREGKNMGKKKWDIVIGNPPYQIEAPGTSTSDKPVYHLFLEEAQKIGEKVELITPGRFLFNAGATPKQWNEKMLNDPHLSVLMYEQKSAEVFPNTDIKGGVVVTYWDKDSKKGPILTFTPFEELNSILRKVEATHPESLKGIIYNQTKFNLENLYRKYPSYKNIIGSNGKDKRLRNNIFEKIDAFSEARRSEDDFEIKGLINNKRVSRFIEKGVIDLDHENLFKWKILVPRANGSGALGEVLSTPLIGQPLIGHTQSFISIGAFDSEKEAIATLKYIKSKFARTLLGVLKITQDNPPEKWKYVPLQDFTSNSDIDWSKSIPEIDQQLYKKFGLSPEEIEFIESHVKEME
ncbi:MAG: Eco57I restriction-modification methylase domain-containing protein [Allobaculum sp.]